MQTTPPPHIGLLAEKSLHAALKVFYARPGDEIETRLGGYVIDIVRGDLLIEIQTRNFSAIKRKLTNLLDSHRVCLVHPVPQQKWIVRQTAGGEPVSRRKSPKRGRVVEVFRELVRIPHLLPHPNLTLEVALTHEDEIWRDDGKGSWRRKGWSRYDRHLLEVAERFTFKTPADYLALLPGSLPLPFSNQDLAAALNVRPNLVRKMTYTLRAAGFIVQTGKRRNAHLYRPADEFVRE